ncbi:glycerophosphodiester phosphodiesterase family protein [Streptomyces morookaense]|uniref:glycerophosphodiester phosphodiesterase n=1 Tax=Streptomyces morookaense TaxID=1970 RepID=UPI0033E68BB8
MRIRPVPSVTGALLVLALALPALGTPPAHARARQELPVTIGHRGVPAQAPENTLASIDRAAALGIRWVENDVQRTRDGQLVVLHDTTLERTTDARRRFPGRAPWKVGDFTLAEIETLDAGSWFDRRFAGERVPTLSSYLRRVDHNHQRLLLELKAPGLYPGVEQQTVDVLRRAGWLDRRHVKDRLVVQSFDAASLRTLHRLRPDVKKGFLGAPKTADLRSYAAFADQINPDHGNVTADWVRAVHALNGPHGHRLEIAAWTVDDPARAVRLGRLGVDAIISNAPHVIQAALAEESGEDPFAGVPPEPAAL